MIKFICVAAGLIGYVLVAPFRTREWEEWEKYNEQSRD
jgi:hypothetical protein